MTLTYKSDNGDKTFTIVDRSTIEEKDIVSVEGICDEIVELWKDMPEPVRKRRILLNTINGNSSMISDNNRKRYFEFEKEFFDDNSEEYSFSDEIESDTIILDSEVKSFSNKIDFNMEFCRRCFDKIVFSYVKEALKRNNISLLSCDDKIWNYDISEREENILNSWTNMYVHLRYDEAMKEVDKYHDEINEYESRFVPGSGPARTVFGELLRACQRVVYRFFNDGDCCCRLYDGNIISYLNIPQILYLTLDDDQEEAKYLIERFKECLEDNYAKGWQIRIRDFESLFCESEPGEMCVINCVRLEKALIDTKEKYPEFLNIENHYDSRNWITWGFNGV